MATRETRLLRGRRRGRALAARSLSELRDRRTVLGVSQRTMAGELGFSQPNLWRLEANPESVTVVRLSEMASLLGLELSMGLHELGDPIRDRGQQAVGKRLDAMVGPAWRVSAETLLPGPGELRSWDRLLRLTGAQPRHLVGVDIETRIRDIQALVRRTRLRERDGNVDAILLVLSDTSTNRRLAGELRDTLGPDYGTAARVIFKALRKGEPLPGSGVVLI